MGGPSVPNANKVADQALQYGIKAGVAQNELNQVNQITPTGSLTYSPVKSPDKWVAKRGPHGNIARDTTGKPVMVNMGGKAQFNADGTPKTKAVTKLNPDQQALLNAQTATNTAGAGAAGNIIGANAGNWAAGPDVNETGITKAIMGWGHDYLQPVFDSQNAAADAKLANQGIAPGSEAWTNAHRDTSRNQNDAYTQLLLQGQGQALSAAEAKYMDPLRAISTLSSGAQPAVNFAQTPQAGVTAPDYTTAANNQYNAKKANSDALMGGLFKIPQTILGGWASGGL